MSLPEGHLPQSLANFCAQAKHCCTLPLALGTVNQQLASIWIKFAHGLPTVGSIEKVTSHLKVS